MSAHPLRQSDCGLSEPVIRKICDVFKRYPQVEKAVLYGSRAKAAHKTGSDIDLTLHGRTDLTLNVLLRIANDLDDLFLPYTFDLSIFRDITDPDVTSIFGASASQCTRNQHHKHRSTSKPSFFPKTRFLP